jgi:hypothetical protein
VRDELNCGDADRGFGRPRGVEDLRVALAGADAIDIAEQKAKDLHEQANTFRDLSTSLAREDAEPS